MNESFTDIAKQWIEEVSKKQKLTKHQKSAVISFALWADMVIRDDELRKELKNGEEN